MVSSVTYTVGSFIPQLPVCNAGDTVAIYNHSVAGVRLLVTSQIHCPAGLNQLILTFCILNKPMNLWAFHPLAGLVVAQPTHNATFTQDST